MVLVLIKRPHDGRGLESEWGQLGADEQRARPVRVPPGTEGSRREFALSWIGPQKAGPVASVGHSQRPLTVPGGTLTGISCAHGISRRRLRTRARAAFFRPTA